MARGPMNGPAARGAAAGLPRLKNIDKGTIKRLLSYVKKYRILLVIAIISIIISAISGVVGSMFIETLIDDYITPLIGAQNPIYISLLKALSIMALIYIIGIIANYLCNRVMVTISQGVLKTIRDEMFDKMQELPISYFDTHTHGEVMSHYTNDTDTLRQMISQGIPQIISSIITIVAVFCAMLYISIHLTFVEIFIVIIMFIITAKVGGASSKYFMAQQESIGKLNGFVEEMINGQKVIKVFCHEEKAKKDFDILNDNLCKSATKAHEYANMLLPIMGNLGRFAYVLIAIVGGILTINNIGGVTVGAIASFLMLNQSFTRPVSQVSQQINSIIMALAGAKRIFDLMDQKPEDDEGYVTLVNIKKEDGEIIEASEHTGMWAWKHPHQDGTLTYEELKGDIVLENVSFGYNPNKKVLKNISLYAKPGQKIAFVGATGAGKTTITNLINRFYDISEGKIRYDGINIKKIKKDDLRRSLGIVLQDTHLFTGTIRDNIKYGLDTATDEQVIEAAKLANAHDFISKLPDGYDTLIDGNGGRLSQGQKQLLSIARAALADPPVMILDEATSSIDTRTEKIVQDGMDKLMNGRTVFVIAHRLSTVQNSKAIMVLDHGEIIERGDHDDLIKQKGQYYQLYTGAFELE